MIPDQADPDDTVDIKKGLETSAGRAQDARVTPTLASVAPPEQRNARTRTQQKVVTGAVSWVAGGGKSVLYQHFAEQLAAAMKEQGLNASEVARRIWGTKKDRRNYDVARNRDAGAAHQRLEDVLVHADRGGEHAGTDVRDTGELAEALHGAVLAERAVQDWQDDVDGAERLGRSRVREHRQRLRHVTLQQTVAWLFERPAAVPAGERSKATSRRARLTATSSRAGSTGFSR